MCFPPYTCIPTSAVTSKSLAAYYDIEQQYWESFNVLRCCHLNQRSDAKRPANVQASLCGDFHDNFEYKPSLFPLSEDRRRKKHTLHNWRLKLVPHGSGLINELE
jgi:hypothetical protein